MVGQVGVGFHRHLWSVVIIGTIACMWMGSFTLDMYSGRLCPHPAAGLSVGAGEDRLVELSVLDKGGGTNIVWY